MYKKLWFLKGVDDVKSWTSCVGLLTCLIRLISVGKAVQNNPDARTLTLTNSLVTEAC